MLSRAIAVVSIAAFVVAGCGDGRKRRAGTVTPGVRDSGPSTVRDGGVVATRDGGPDLCADNPNSCVAHQLKSSPPACSCLAVCESGWSWTGVECVQSTRDGGTNAGRDGGTNPGRDGGPNPGRDGGVVPSDPLNVATSAARFAQAVCQYRTRCEPAFYSFLRETEADCLADQQQGQSVVYGVYSSMIAAGRLGFSQQRFDACMTSYATASCELDLAPACDTIFTGNRGVGQSCQYSEECAGDGWCNTTSFGACGTCRAASGNGADCSASVCAAGLVCATAGTQTICVPGGAGVGQPCGDINTGLCAGQLQCVAGTCRAPAGAGQTCDPAQTTGPDCNILRNSICTNGTCATGSWGGGGSSCAPPNACDYTSGCDGATMMCRAWPGTGLACDGGNCAPDNYCNASNICTASGQLGASCTTADQCAVGSWCFNSTCGPLQYQVCP